jgi:hypothetical protein
MDCDGAVDVTIMIPERAMTGETLKIRDTRRFIMGESVP